MRIVVTKDKCIGAGNCALTAPDVFDQDDEDGLVALLVETPAPGQHDAVQEAVIRCPGVAISTID